MVGNQPIYRLLLYAILALLVVYVGVRQVQRHHRRAVRAQETARALAAFSAHEFTTEDGHKLPYRLLLPRGYDPQRQYPLILFLHGISECGRDNRRPVAWLGEAFLQPSFRAAYPCFVLVPQCPSMEDWAGDNFVASRYRMYAEETPSLRATRALIDALARQYPIDRRRLYATGFSMGASGVWDLLGRHPGLFAAAIPVAGYTDTWTAPRLKHTPVWVFHSTRDRIMPVQESREMAAALRAAGCPVRYTEYPHTTHDCWRKALNEPELFAWLFAQQLPDRNNRK